MRRKRLLIFLVVVLVFGTALWRAPASLASNWLEKSSHPLQLQMTSGTLWNGSARQTSWQGLLLGQSHWRLTGLQFSPLALQYDIDSDSRQFQVSGQVAATPGGAIQARKITGRMPATWVDLQSFIPLVFLTGHFEWQLDYLDWPATGLPVAAGKFYWREAGLTGLARANLGELEILLEKPAGQLIAGVSSLADADVRINGQIQTDGNEYTLDIDLAVASGREDIFDLLAPLGELQANGEIRFNWTGKLFPK